MSNRCGSCGKLASLETQEPEVDLDITESTISITVRLVRASECCGEEVKEASFEETAELPKEVIDAHPLDAEDADGQLLHELEVKEHDVEATERSEGKGRGLKSFYGFNVNYGVRCSCQVTGTEDVYEGEFSDDMQASHFDDLG